MKKALPENGKIAKDAKETVQECVSEFIGFITSEACEKCKNEKRKTINGDDLLFAMNTLGFESYIEILRIYLHKYREAVKLQEKNENEDSNARANNNNDKKMKTNADDGDDDDEDDSKEDDEENEGDNQDDKLMTMEKKENI